ncbi:MULTISPECIES: hypothetical protein [unclassified Mycolicibacterium]|uniref:hypothetical protein n=1 Tax=unclassified Mycolicibacterium TaxID=2636767 RepID=UPI0012DCB420|nr:MULTISPECIES: hypothetical protein [unclassified Mycolicibacterium]MUL83796.1 hypothetical protein [Mycolicibacterium sp. CBMA 329]MUL90138.1 hypothetical protein [Mycolicibacterium sp. CBMA 331]MUM00907.1 hypothetical protein [Mycolicibacterium sp. CBMA 334]MUM27450.1 hypothetical protein [Mycolicibacterium sp. CBMA 295]MUM39653.1 hypothetical protein [Mycolicibacterium sp. CBMA 247]
MQVTARSPLAAGVALIGATAIALTPISVTPAAPLTPATHSAAVELTASIDPLKAWVDLFTNTGVNVTTLGEQILSNPAPILTQMLHNGAGYAQTVATIAQGMGNGFVEWVNNLPLFVDMTKDALAKGQIDQALMAALVYIPMGLAMNLMMPLMSLSQISVGITENLYNVAKTIANPMTLFGTVLGSVQILSSTVGQLGVGVQSFVDAVKAGDVQGAVNALIATPALVLNGLINGTQYTPGILTPNKDIFQGMPGPIGALLVGVRQAIAQALGAPAPTPPSARTADQIAPVGAPAVEDPSAANAVPKLTATAVTVNLTTVPQAVAASKAEAVTATETAASEAPATEQAPAAGTTPDAATGSGTTGSVGETDATTPTDTDVKGSGESAAPKPGTIVRNSPKAEPGKPGIATKKAGSEVKEAVDSVGKEINSTVKKISDGLKNGFGKSAKGKTDTGGASSGGGTGASDNAA